MISYTAAAVYVYVCIIHTTYCSCCRCCKAYRVVAVYTGHGLYLYIMYNVEKGVGHDEFEYVSDDPGQRKVGVVCLLCIIVFLYLVVYSSSSHVFWPLEKEKIPESVSQYVRYTAAVLLYSQQATNAATDAVAFSQHVLYVWYVLL